MQDAPVGSSLRIREVRSPADRALVRALFLEYAQEVDVDLSKQGFHQEVQSLPGEYAPPRGRLWLASMGRSVAGCVALRPLTPRTGEVKRLFVSPPFRAQGTGRALMERLVSTARRLGYARVRLDTLPSMTKARRLYAEMGFRPIPAYYRSPFAGTTYLELDLTESRRRLNRPAREPTISS